MPALDQFLKAIARLNQVNGEYGDIVKARRIPDEMAGEIGGLEINFRYSGRASEEVRAKAAAVLKETAARERAAGERKRDAILLALSKEIEAIRLNLPAMVAGAQIELGQIARGLREESRRG